MVSPSTDRRFGLTAGVAIKAPCQVATTANITLNGEQTIDGTLTDESRVLVPNQTDATENGIYRSDDGDWSREVDANGNRDLVFGTLVYVNGGSANASTNWVFTSDDPEIGTDDIGIALNTSFPVAVSNTTDYELGSQAAAASHTGIITGHVIRTNYLDGNRTSESGSEVSFNGTTTIGEAGNWPATNGKFHDADGKEFETIGPISVFQFGAAVGGAAATNTVAIQIVLNLIPSDDSGLDIDFGAGNIFDIDAPLTVTSKENFSMTGNNSWIRQNTTDTDGMVLDQCSKVAIDGLNIISLTNGTPSRGLSLLRTHRSQFSNMFLRGYFYGLYAEGSLLNRYENISGGGNILAGIVGALPFQSYCMYFIKHVASGISCTYSTIINPICEGALLDGIFMENVIGMQILSGASEGHATGSADHRGIYIKDSTQCSIIGLDSEANGDGVTADIILEGELSASQTARHTLINVHCSYLKLDAAEDCVIQNCESDYVNVNVTSINATFTNYTWGQAGGPPTGKFTDDSLTTTWLQSRQSNSLTLTTSKISSVSAATGRTNHDSVAGVLTINARFSNAHSVTLDENITSIVVSDVAGIGQHITFIFEQDGSGGKTVTGWPGTVRWKNGVQFQPGLGANIRSSVTLVNTNHPATVFIEVARNSPIDTFESVVARGADATGTNVMSANANALAVNTGFLLTKLQDGTDVYVPYWTDVTP